MSGPLIEAIPDLRSLYVSWRRSTVLIPSIVTVFMIHYVLASGDPSSLVFGEQVLRPPDLKGVVMNTDIGATKCR
jgi:hypothetical protein